MGELRDKPLSISPGKVTLPGVVATVTEETVLRTTSSDVIRKTPHIKSAGTEQDVESVIEISYRPDQSKYSFKWVEDERNKAKLARELLKDVEGLDIPIVYPVFNPERNRFGKMSVEVGHYSSWDLRHMLEFDEVWRKDSRLRKVFQEFTAEDFKRARAILKKSEKILKSKGWWKSQFSPDEIFIRKTKEGQIRLTILDWGHLEKWYGTKAQRETEEQISNENFGDY